MNRIEEVAVTYVYTRLTSPDGVCVVWGTNCIAMASRVYLVSMRHLFRYVGLVKL